MDLFDFAMVLDVQPPQADKQFERAVRMARPLPGMRVTVRSECLLLFTVEAEMEFLAIEKAEQWLQSIAKANPPIKVNTNPQPSHEV